MAEPSVLSTSTSGPVDIWCRYLVCRYVDNLNVYKVDIPPSCGQFSGDIPAATAAEQSEGRHGAADTCQLGQLMSCICVAAEERRQVVSLNINIKS